MGPKSGQPGMGPKPAGQEGPKAPGQRSLTWRVFAYNLVVIFVLIASTATAFNLAVRAYVERDIREQLDRIAQRAQGSLTRPGPAVRRGFGNAPGGSGNPVFYAFGLDRALRAPLTVLNADYILFDSEKNSISFLPEDFKSPFGDAAEDIERQLKQRTDFGSRSYVRLVADGTPYIAVVEPVPQGNPLGVSWIVIYSSLQKLNEMQTGVNRILAAILLVAAVVSAFVSSLMSRRITAPLVSLSEHIRAIAQRRFGTRIDIPVDVELQRLVDSVNTMSEKINAYDKAQKTFLQNASHEFRTPLMAIRSYAEGIKHDVVEKEKAADVILQESKRLVSMVEDLLYLSRLDSMEEPYEFRDVKVTDVVQQCLERIDALAAREGKDVQAEGLELQATLPADEDKLVRAIFNVLVNGLRYAERRVWVRVQQRRDGRLELTVADDGPGIDPDDLPHIFHRFYKGRNGIVGLGLAISKHIVERHGGSIAAENSGEGAVFTIVLPQMGG